MAVRKNVQLGYRLDWTNNRMIINHKFAQRAEDFDSDESKLILKIQKDFPQIEICEESGRNIKKDRFSKGLTYDYMRNVISMLPNGKELLDEFNNKVLVIPDSRHRYQFAKEWFISEVPDYKSPFDTLERIRSTEMAKNVPVFEAKKSAGKFPAKLN
ncbi:MAG: hypothetical protein IJ136_06430 [Erysipelotrichaceae bacterium]|nr:hypothetical protein [Erysipelotrichaceae bacterium]